MAISTLLELITITLLALGVGVIAAALVGGLLGVGVGFVGGAAVFGVVAWLVNRVEARA